MYKHIHIINTKMVVVVFKHLNRRNLAAAYHVLWVLSFLRIVGELVKTQSPKYNLGLGALGGVQEPELKRTIPK